MKLATRNILSERTERAWLGCFGPASEMVELPAETEDQRIWACAVIYADDLRYLPETGLAQASAEERMFAALIWCRFLRDVEAGRIGRIWGPES